MFCILFQVSFSTGKQVTSDLWQRSLEEDLARVVYDPTTKISRDFDKLEDLVHPSLISPKVLERDVLNYFQGKLEMLRRSERIKIHINFNLRSLNINLFLWQLL